MQSGNSNVVDALLGFINQKERLKKSHLLKLLLWEPSLQCNLSCLHCSDNCSPSYSKTDDLTTQEIKTVLSEIAKSYDASNIFFALTGGEPLLREDLFEVVSHAIKLGFRWGMTSNGMLLTKEMAKRVKEHQINSIAISVDGLEDAHNTLRASSKSFQKAIEAIENLSETGISNITIISCVNSLNITSLEEFIDFVERLPVHTLRLTPIFFEGRALEHQALALNPDELKKLLDIVVVYREKRAKIDITLSDDRYYGPEYECRVRNYMHHCSAGIEWAGILHDGAVIGATHISREYIEGNIREDSFVEIWEHRFERYREGRKALFAPYCGECEHSELCEGGGFHLISQYKMGIQCAYHQLQERNDNG